MVRSSWFFVTTAASFLWRKHNYSKLQQSKEKNVINILRYLVFFSVTSQCEYFSQYEALFLFHSSGFYSFYNFSSIIALAPPPPLHMEAMPFWPDSSAWARCMTILAPEAPNGCPRLTAPPWIFTLAGNFKKIHRF